MIPRTLDNFDNLQLSVRPLIHAYLLWDGDFDMMAKLVPLMCSQWGGVRSLLVPVGRTGKIHGLHKEFLRSHTPDVFVDCCRADRVPSAKLEITRAELSTVLPRRRISLVEWAGFEQRDRALHVSQAIPDAVRQQSPVVRHLLAGRSTKRDRVLHSLVFGTPYDDQIAPRERFS